MVNALFADFDRKAIPQQEFISSRSSAQSPTCNCGSKGERNSNTAGDRKKSRHRWRRRLEKQRRATALFEPNIPKDFEAA